jgi:hypothetical protein
MHNLHWRLKLSLLQLCISEPVLTYHSNFYSLASNGRSLVQPSGEIKFRATNSTAKSKLSASSSSSNLKRKRIDSSLSPPLTANAASVHSVKIPTTQIEALRRLLLSCRPEEFRGPPLPFDDPTYNRDSYFQKDTLTWQKYCFICRKSSKNHIPSIHCDYCPLTYHLDCLNPPMTSLPSSTDKWMCPNHIEPILDRYLLRKKKFSTCERVKIYQQYSQIEHKTIIQDFTQMRQKKLHLLSKTSGHHRLERIEISQIPKAIEEFYLNANTKSKQICLHDIHDDIENEEKEEDEARVQVSPYYHVLSIICEMSSDTRRHVVPRIHVRAAHVPLQSQKDASAVLFSNDA